VHDGRTRKVLGAIAAVAALLTMAGCGGRDRTANVESAASANAAPGSVAPAPVQKLAAAQPPSPTPSRSTAAPKRTSPTAKPSPVVPSRDPVKAAQPLPPPPHPPGAAPESSAPTSPAPGASCPSYAGPTAPKADVRAALDAAAAKQFWPVSAPSIMLPASLLYAVGWQESGWQSTIVACDGGIGTMQIMPGTAKWMNDRFATSYDLNTLNGNVMIGGEYLAWLVKYFGDAYYQGSYDLSVPAPPGGVSLLDSIVSAYNYGPGAVDPTKGQAGIPNWRYVNNVEALMTNCPCLS
jgi:soluble lytic murein transglycosylase-like protein